MSVRHSVSAGVDIHSTGNNSSSNGATGEQSFMTILQQAGMGGKAAKNASNINAAQLDEIVSNFVSKAVKKMCISLATSGKPIKESGDHVMKPGGLNNSSSLVPNVIEAFGAVVMVDVSGYSKLAASFAEMGPQGAAIFSKTMKGYLDQIIEVIVSHGGDIVKFAGDAVVVYWSSKSAIHITDSREDIERGELVYKAALCCLTLLTKLGTYEINIPDCPTKALRIHLGIGAGLINEVIVGGFPGRWEHFIAGDAVNQLSQVLDIAKAGELALSHAALKWLVWVVDIRTLSLGEYDKRCIILQGLRKAERRVPVLKEAEENQLPRELNSGEKEQYCGLYRQFMDKTALFKLQADINQSNLFQMDPSLKELLELSELRQITTIFIKIESLKDCQTGADLLEQSQDAISVVQTALARCEGSLRQFHVDDKGSTILCFFGLPPLAHENDARLGISAGIEIRDKFDEMFDEFTMGITTGVVSFGGVGAAGRAEYAVMGDSINMAARLMCHSYATRGILCDQKTYNLCSGEFQFDSLGETTVKGKKEPISIFRPVAAIPETEKINKPENAIATSEVIGREEEKQAILDNLNQLSTSSEVDMLFFLADGGLGLSTLVNIAQVEALKQGCNICIGKGGQMEQNNFFVWQSIVLDLIQLLLAGSRDKQNHFRIPGNAGTQGINSEIVLPSNPILLKPGSKPKRKDASNPVSSFRGRTDTDSEILNEKPPPKHSRRASYSKTLSPTDADKLKKAASSAHSINPSGDLKDSSDYFSDDKEAIEARFKSAMEKIELGEKEASLLIMLTNKRGDESAEVDQANLRLHSKDLTNILVKIINTLTLHNKVIVQITECHWIDSLSWELLLELAQMCPRLSIMCFSRPDAMFDSKENRRLYKLLEHHKRAKSWTLKGLNAKQCDMLILSIWNMRNVCSVDPRISDTIFKRTDGNPFYIKSLVMALKDSGQWRVSASGMLTTPDSNFDFDKLVLGYDNQSIVLAQFDRLDRNFQLFLKVASVLGQKFALDDVLYFLTGVQNACEQLNRKNYSDLITGLQATDKYGFLQKDSFSDGATFQFKSALVRQCVYNMMVINQRQQIHFLIATYIEAKTNDSNRHRFVVQILEHFMGASSQHILKRISYTALAANYFFEKESVGESIKYFKQLLELLKETTPQEMDTTCIANYNRELGYMLLLKEELDEAEFHLKACLDLMKFSFPTDGYKFKWAVNAEIAKRKKLDKTFFKDRPVPQEEDYTQSYVARKGASGYSLTNLSMPLSAAATESKKVAESNISNFVIPKTANLTPGQQMIRDTRFSPLRIQQHALVLLAEVYMKKGLFDNFNFCVLTGLNLSEESSAETHLTRLFSLGALAQRFIDPPRNITLSAQYMEAAVSYDLRIDILTSLQQVKNNAILLLLGGQLEASSNKLEVVSYLSTMSNDLNSRVYGLHLKCIIQTHSTSRELALSTSRVLYELSSQRDNMAGRIWGCFHIIQNLLGDPYGEEEIKFKLKEMKELWEQCKTKTYPSHISLDIAKDCITIAAPFFQKKGSPDLKSMLGDINDKISRLKPHDWQGFIGLLPFSLAIFTAINRDLVTDAELVKQLDVICDTCNKALKSMNALSITENIRRIFKGIKLRLKDKSMAAYKAWQKGISDDSEDLYTQAVLCSAISNVMEAEDFADKAEDHIRDLKSSAKFAVVFPK